jgi:hypothetical protein
MNLERFRDIDEIKYHLCRFGFMSGYTIWVHHGELAERKERLQSVDNENVDLDEICNENFDLEELLNENVKNENIDLEEFLNENGENENIDNDNENIEFDEMMSDVEPNCAYIPEILT